MKLSLTLFAILTMGCQEDAADELTGRRFLLQSSSGYEVLANTIVQVGFEGRDLSLYAGCNNMSGTYDLNGGVLVVGPLGSTEIGCGNGGLQQDEWFGAFVSTRPKFMLDENTLTLTGASATLVFLDREIANPDRPLVGPSWTVDTILSKDAARDIGKKTTLTISFASDGRVGLRAACNGGSGSYTVSGDQITLTNVNFEEVACPDDSAAVSQFQELFGRPKLSFEIDAQRLTLKAGELGVSATAP